MVHAEDDPSFAGRYELQGVMETAGLLVLEANHQYQATFSYGAADWEEAGTWKSEGGQAILLGGHFKTKNHSEIPLLLSDGIKFQYSDGKLSSMDGKQKLVFLDPNKSHSSEGKMHVQGKVTQWDSKVLMVNTGKECITFDATGFSETLQKQMKGKVGKTIDVEIPYSAIVSGGSC